MKREDLLNQTSADLVAYQQQRSQDVVSPQYTAGTTLQGADLEILNAVRSDMQQVHSILAERGLRAVINTDGSFEVESL